MENDISLRDVWQKIKNHHPEVFMRKWISLLILIVMLTLPSLAAAQGEAHISALDIKLWPEYDQPGVLVIYDFRLTAQTSLPARVTFLIPADGNVIAVASLQNGSLANAAYEGPVAAGNWQELTILVDTNTGYHFEYYAPLIKTDHQRRYSFLWTGEYAVDQLSISVQQPPTATSLTGTPALAASVDTDGLTYHSLQTANLKMGEQFELVLEYNKPNDDLTAPSAVIQPSAPLSEDTTGRVSLSNYLPYLAGGLGLVLIVSGLGYYYLFARRNSNGKVRRRRSTSEDGQANSKEIYCSQCGERARPGDRFCRTCGTRIRQTG
jgi:ribosomal protein L32